MISRPSMARYTVTEAPEWLAVRDGYKLHLLTQGRSKSTIESYFHAVSMFARWCQAEAVPLVRAEREAVRRYLAGVYERHHVSTASKTVMALRSFYRYAVQEGMRIDEPTADVKARKPRPISREPFSDDELQALFAATETLRERAMLYVLAATGIRRTELLSMRKSDLNWERGHIVIRGKGDKQRYVATGQRALEALRDYVEGPRGTIRTDEIDWEGGRVLVRCDSGMLLRLRLQPRILSALRRDLHPDEDAGDSVWTGGMGELHNNGMREALLELGRRAGVENVYTHRFRTTFAHRFLEAGGDMVALQDRMGHTNIEQTAHYARFRAAERGLELQGTIADSLYDQPPEPTADRAEHVRRAPEPLRLSREVASRRNGRSPSRIRRYRRAAARKGGAL